MENLSVKIWKDAEDVNARLRELALSREGLTRVRDEALAAAANTTPYHAANAAGTYAYQEGVRALRLVFVGEDWKPDRSNGVEFIRNDERRIRVGFANVDKSGDFTLSPKARSAKGAGTERACQGNLFEGIEEYVPVPDENWSTYYLMVDLDGSAELSRPIVAEGNFSQCVERIFISESGDFDPESIVFSGDNEPVNDFEPVVTRR